jgi:hypothetical protein
VQSTSIFNLRNIGSQYYTSHFLSSNHFKILCNRSVNLLLSILKNVQNVIPSVANILWHECFNKLDTAFIKKQKITDRRKWKMNNSVLFTTCLALRVIKKENSNQVSFIGCLDGTKFRVRSWIKPNQDPTFR